MYICLHFQFGGAYVVHKNSWFSKDGIKDTCKGRTYEGRHFAISDVSQSGGVGGCSRGRACLGMKPEVECLGILRGRELQAGLMRRKRYDFFLFYLFNLGVVMLLYSIHGHIIMLGTYCNDFVFNNEIYFLYYANSYQMCHVKYP